MQDFFFALPEPLPVHLPRLNFVLCFTYHLPPPLHFSSSASLSRSGSKIPTRSCGSQNKHGGENSIDCRSRGSVNLWTRGFADNTEAAKNVFLARYLAKLYFYLLFFSNLQI